MLFFCASTGTPSRAGFSDSPTKSLRTLRPDHVSLEPKNGRFQICCNWTSSFGHHISKVDSMVFRAVPCPELVDRLGSSPKVSVLSAFAALELSQRPHQVGYDYAQEIRRHVGIGKSLVIAPRPRSSTTVRSGSLASRTRGRTTFPEAPAQVRAPSYAFGDVLRHPWVSRLDYAGEPFIQRLRDLLVSTRQTELRKIFIGFLRLRSGRCKTVILIDQNQSAKIWRLNPTPRRIALRTYPNRRLVRSQTMNSGLSCGAFTDVSPRWLV